MAGDAGSHARRTVLFSVSADHPYTHQLTLPRRLTAGPWRERGLHICATQTSLEMSRGFGPTLRRGTTRCHPLGVLSMIGNLVSLLSQQRQDVEVSVTKTSKNQITLPKKTSDHSPDWSSWTKFPCAIEIRVIRQILTQVVDFGVPLRPPPIARHSRDLPPHPYRHSPGASPIG